MLGTPAMLRRLRPLEKEALEADRFGGLVHVVEHDLGFAMYRAVQACKAELSKRDEARFVFVDEDVCVDAAVRRSDFEASLMHLPVSVETNERQSRRLPPSFDTLTP